MSNARATRCGWLAPLGVFSGHRRALHRPSRFGWVVADAIQIAVAGVSTVAGHASPGRPEQVPLASPRGSDVRSHERNPADVVDSGLPRCGADEPGCGRLHGGARPPPPTLRALDLPSR